MLYIVIVQMGMYKHWALLSDRFSAGKPMLISNKWRNGTVKEESWDQVAGNRPYKIHKVKTPTPVHLILANARNAVGRVKYDLLQYNCEHFVRDIVTGVAKSSQIHKAVAAGGLIFGALFVVAQA